MNCINLEINRTVISYFADSFTELNEVNMKLQRSKICFIKGYNNGTYQQNSSL